MKAGFEAMVATFGERAGIPNAFETTCCMVAFGGLLLAAGFVFVALTMFSPGLLS